MIRVLLLALVVSGIWYAWRRVQTLPPDQRKSVGWKLALGALVAISLAAVATGRLHWIGGALAVLAAVAKFGAHALFRLWPLLRATGKDAVFRTEHLEVRFLVKTGQLQGTVLKGLYQGEHLHQMTPEQLQELADRYRETDRKSFYLVKVFLQRAGADHGRFRYQEADSAQHSGGFSSKPDRDEALLILGLSGNPTPKEVIAAHRRLIQKLHPDRGGNDYLAARINQAKDTLLR